VEKRSDTDVLPENIPKMMMTDNILRHRPSYRWQSTNRWQSTADTWLPLRGAFIDSTKTKLVLDQCWLDTRIPYNFQWSSDSTPVLSVTLEQGSSYYVWNSHSYLQCMRHAEHVAWTVLSERCCPDMHCSSIYDGLIPDTFGHVWTQMSTHSWKSTYPWKPWVCRRNQL
jgi:hypothetical protein